MSTQEPARSTPETSFESKNGNPERKLPVVGHSDVAIYWDYENLRIPEWCPVSKATESIRQKVEKYGRIVEKRLYYDSRRPTESAAPRAELDLSGFTLVDCPSRNRKETLDKKLIVDVLFFAWERASMGARACVVLITSDGDYSYAVARLRDIGVFTIVMYRPDNVAKVLIDNSNIVMSWEFDVLGGPPSQDEEETSTVHTTDSEKLDSNELKEDSTNEPCEIVVKQPSQQNRDKFTLFCNVVLNAQYRNVVQGISVYSSWASEAGTAAMFYEKVGQKDRDLYLNLRNLGSQKGFIEWGRRDLALPGKPVIKVRSRDERSDGLSLESYVRLTYSGLAILKPSISAQESDWTPVLPKKIKVPDKDGGPLSVSPSPKPMKGTFSSRNLFVGGLAWQTTENSIHSYFQQFGPLENVVVMHGRGFGFVLFRHSNDAAGVLKHTDPHVVDRKIVDVKPYDQSQA